ncbi:hypothetical protein WA158_006160 [Blastocystis sp. Blastoise]
MSFIARFNNVSLLKSASLLRSIYTGKVKWFNNKKGYGFIVPNPTADLKGEIFVHQSAIKSDGFRFLKNEEEVEFDIKNSEKGPQAINVSAPGGLPFNRSLQ